jgi:hypothetical protein
MFSRVEKIALVVSGIEIVGGLVWSAILYGQSRYYQGRIDVRKEMFGHEREIK